MSGAGIKFNWAVKYLYDGECSMCLTLKAVLERNDRAKAIRFVDISDIDYDPMANMGVVRLLMYRMPLPLLLLPLLLLPPLLPLLLLPPLPPLLLLLLLLLPLPLPLPLPLLLTPSHVFSMRCVLCAGVSAALAARPLPRSLFAASCAPITSPDHLNPPCNSSNLTIQSTSPPPLPIGQNPKPQTQKTGV